MIPRTVGQRMFAGLGSVAHRILAKDRQRAIDNLGIAFPELDETFRRAMTRAMFKSLGRNAFDFLNLEGSSLEQLDKIVVEVKGQDILDRVREAGKGFIVITGHIGCWELLPAYFTVQGYPVSVVARTMKERRLNEKLVDIRKSVGVTSIDRESSPRMMLEVLRRKEILGVLIDQHTAVGGEYVPFFGRPAYTPTAVAKLAIMTGVPILPMAVMMNKAGNHVMHVLPPVNVPQHPENREAAVHEVTRDCSLAIENLIRIDPKQWVWFHHRWREPEVVAGNGAGNGAGSSDGAYAIQT